MDTLLLIIGLVAVALVLLRPTARPMIVYVPIEVAEAHGGLGCLPLLVVALLVLLALGVGRI